MKKLALISLSLLFTGCFRASVTGPKFAVGECTQSDSQREAWEKDPETILKVVEIGEKKYRLKYRNPYRSSLIGETTYSFYMAELGQKVVPCPADYQEIQ